MYHVSTYDSDDGPGKDGKWTLFASVERPMQLRPIIRELRGMGYSKVSVAIDGPPEVSPLTSDDEAMLGAIENSDATFAKLLVDGLCPGT